MAAKKQRQKCPPKKKKASPIRSTDVELVIIEQKPRAPRKKPVKKEKSAKKQVIIIPNRHQEFQKLMKPKKTVDQIRLQILQGKHSKFQTNSAKYINTSNSDYQYTINNQFTEIYNMLINQPIKSDLKPTTLKSKIIQMMQIMIEPVKQRTPTIQITLCDLLKSTAQFSVDCRGRHHQDLLTDIKDNQFKISGLQFRYNFRLLKSQKTITNQQAIISKFRLIQTQVIELPKPKNRSSEYQNDLKEHIREGLIIQFEQKPLEQVEIFKVPKQIYEVTMMQSIGIQLPPNKNLEIYQKKSTLITIDRRQKQYDIPPEEQQITVLQQEQKRQPQRMSNEYHDDQCISDRNQQKKKGKQSIKHKQDDSAKKSLRNRKVSQNTKDLRVVSLNIKQENNYIYNQVSDEQNIQVKMNNNLDKFIDNKIYPRKNQSMNNKMQKQQKNNAEIQEFYQVYPNQQNQKKKRQQQDDISEQSEQDAYGSYNHIPQHPPQNRVKSLDDKQNHLISKNQNQANLKKRSSLKQPQLQYQEFESRERKRFQGISPEEFNPRFQAQPQQQQSRMAFQQEKSHYYDDQYQNRSRPDIRRFHQLDEAMPFKQHPPNMVNQDQRILNPKQPIVRQENPFIQNNLYQQVQQYEDNPDVSDEDEYQDEEQNYVHNQQKAKPYVVRNNQCRTPPHKNQKKQQYYQNPIPIQEKRVLSGPYNQAPSNGHNQQFQMPSNYENDQQYYGAQDSRYNQQNIVTGRQYHQNNSNDYQRQNPLNNSNYNNILRDISNGQRSSQFLKGLEVYSYEKKDRVQQGPRSLDRYDLQGLSSGYNNKRYPENMKSSYLQSSLIMSRRDNQKNAKVFVNWVVFISELSTFQLPAVISINNCRISTFRLDEQYFNECEYILMSDSLKLIFLRQEDILLKEMHDILLSGNQGQALAMIGRFFNSLFQELMFKYRKVSIVIFLEFKQKYFSFLINEFIAKNLFQENRIQIFQYGNSEELSQFLFQKLIEFEDISSGQMLQIPENYDRMTQRLNQIDFQELVRLRAANKIYSTLQQAYND